MPPTSFSSSLSSFAVVDVLLLCEDHLYWFERILNICPNADVMGSPLAYDKGAKGAIAEGIILAVHQVHDLAAMLYCDLPLQVKVFRLGFACHISADELKRFPFHLGLSGRRRCMFRHGGVVWRQDDATEGILGEKAGGSTLILARPSRING
jgi:hypothetical protein